MYAIHKGTVTGAIVGYLYGRGAYCPECLKPGGLSHVEDIDDRDLVTINCDVCKSRIVTYAAS